MNYGSASDDALSAFHPDPGFFGEMATAPERVSTNDFFLAPANPRQNLNCSTAVTDSVLLLFTEKMNATDAGKIIASPADRERKGQKIRETGNLG